ncbi:MAG TPA: cell division protein ZapA [Alphaproteobacteria bacterium]|nr:cell division protein ZapA [Alphaproteobacteria bacterium]
MSKLATTLYGREYFINCDPGEEDRLRDIVKFVEKKMQQVADRAGNTTTEPRLFMLTCLLLADELIDIRQKALSASRQDEDLLVAAVEHLKGRIGHIADQVGRA